MEHNNQLPPKSSSVDRLVTNQEDIERVLKGEKTATRRNGGHADPGEIMILGDRKFEVYRVYQQTLGDLTDKDAQTEGFVDVEAYKNHILASHPGMPWLPHMTVWVHEFRPL